MGTRLEARDTTSGLDRQVVADRDGQDTPAHIEVIGLALVPE